MISADGSPSVNFVIGEILPCRVDGELLLIQSLSTTPSTVGTSDCFKSGYETLRFQTVVYRDFNEYVRK